MSDDLVERVARAIAPLAWAALGTGDTFAQKNRRVASLDHARAAIAAIEEAGYVVVPREPTEKMLRAGYYASPDDAQDTWYVGELGTWRAMIQVALEKK